VILAAGKEAQEWGRKEVQKMDGEAIENLRKKGMEIYYLPKDERLRWMKTCKPVLDVIVEKTGDRGRKMLEVAEKAR
jgi:TRAP-type C4-dicarboxylate transport system substrate-binding protein